MQRKLSYNNPLPASINTTPAIAPEFPINIGQIVRIIFAQPYNGGSVGNVFATLADAQTMSSWTAFFAATDGTAMFYTPIMSNSEIGDAKPLQVAADSNVTYGGNPEFYGMGGSMLNGEFRNKDAPSLNSMDALTAFSQQNSGGQSSLSAYLLNQDGYVIGMGSQSGATVSEIQPINIFDFWYGTQTTKGYATATVTKMGLWLPPYWSDNLVFIPPTSTFDLRMLM